MTCPADAAAADMDRPIATQAVAHILFESFRMVLDPSG